MLTMGVDIGSTTSKAAILEDGQRIIAKSIVPVGTGTRGPGEVLHSVLSLAGLQQQDIARTVATGYGRLHFNTADRQVSEVSCHGKGVHFLVPGARTVVDIGGQDAKAILLDENGMLSNFMMNDKCAAGTGRFLELMARTLELSMEEMSYAGLEWKEDIAISSMCTVFAESEVVSLIAQNKDRGDIIHGLNQSVASRTAALCRRLGGEANYMMTGGVSKNRGVVEAIQRELGVELIVSDRAQLNGALGAALFAMES